MQQRKPERQDMPERYYGLDWLRIGAFALLILYHIGMFFVPWEWHVNTAEPLEWLELPMRAINPWRLSLLFVISGIASHSLLRKLGSSKAYARSRSSRLLIPLLAGAILFVAPQPWAELQEKAGYTDGFWHFWVNDYFEFGSSRDIILPTYNHLWFVLYLWVYAMVHAASWALPHEWKLKLLQVFDTIFSGKLLLFLPVAFLFAARTILYPIFGSTHALIDDFANHAVYLSAFFFGVGLAASGSMWTQLVELRMKAVVVAMTGYAVIVTLDLIVPGEAGPAEQLAIAVATSCQAAGAIIALLGFARTSFNVDSRARRYLTAAIFPCYIAHQTIIVLAGHTLKPYALGPGIEFVSMLVATAVGCVVIVELGRRVTLLGPLIGLTAVKPRELIRSDTAQPLHSS